MKKMHTLKINSFTIILLNKKNIEFLIDHYRKLIFCFNEEKIKYFFYFNGQQFCTSDLI